MGQKQGAGFASDRGSLDKLLKANR